MPARSRRSDPQALPRTSMPMSKRRRAISRTSGERRSQAQRPSGPASAAYLLNQGALTGRTSETQGLWSRAPRLQSPTPAAMRASGKSRPSASNSGVTMSRSPMSLLRSTKRERGAAGGRDGEETRAAARRTAPSRRAAPARSTPPRSARRSRRGSGTGAFRAQERHHLPLVLASDLPPGEALVIPVGLQVLRRRGLDAGRRREGAQRGGEPGPQVAHGSSLGGVDRQARLEHLAHAEPPSLDRAGEQAGVVGGQEGRQLAPREGGDEVDASGVPPLRRDLALGRGTATGDGEPVVPRGCQAAAEEVEEPPGSLVRGPAAHPQEADPGAVRRGGSLPPDRGQGGALRLGRRADIDAQLAGPARE